MGAELPNDFGSAHEFNRCAERIADLFGKGLADKLLPLKRDVADGVSLTGFIAAPPESIEADPREGTDS